MNPNKTFLTIEEQIAHLKAKKISIGLNEQSVRETLSKTSYYEIVNGYSEPFRFKPNPKSYLRGVSFKEIYALYFFDKRLRTIILPFLLEVESRLKNDVVYAFLSQKRKDGTPSNKNDDYLKVSSYGKTNIKQAMLCIANFQKIIATYFEQSEAIQHYLTTYGFVPLWVLETKMNFGDLTHFYAVLETNIRQSVSKKYDLADDDFGTIMHVLNITRNCCAHKERLYCIKHNVMLPRLDKNRHQKIVHFTSKGEGDKNLFSAVLGLYIILGEKEINPMLNSIKSEIDSLSKKLKTISIKNIEAIMGFPSDWYTTLSSSHKPSIKTLERA